jgi:hypothetical protein
LAQNRTLFICFDITVFIGDFLVIAFEEVGDVAFVDTPEFFSIYDAFFGLFSEEGDAILYFRPPL